MDGIVAANSFQHQQNELENLPFRKTTFDYLKENANPRLLLKLMQITKFFCFKKFPFFVVENLEITHNWLKNYTFWKYASFPSKNVTVEKIDDTQISKKLWVKDFLKIFTTARQETLTSSMLPRIAVIDISRLELNCQVLSFNEWMFIISSNNITYLKMDFSIVKYDDRTIMPLEKYFECLQNLKIFKYEIDTQMASTITKETTKNLTNLINPSRLTEFALYNIPDSFDFTVFQNFLKSYPHIRYSLKFFVSEEYAKDIKAYIDELIKAGVTEHRPPSVSYYGQPNDSYNAMNDLLKKYYDPQI